MIVIDTHAHLTPQFFPPLPAGVPADEWPEMIPLEDGRARMLIGGKEFRIFEPAYWDVPGRLKYMDSEGVTLQVLSPLPELLGYWFSPQTTAAMADHMHKTIADAIVSAPTRLAGMGMLPLQDVNLSIETARKIKALGLKGALIASNVNGVSIADPRFDPVWAEMEKLGLAIVVHGYRPAGTDRFLGTPMLGPIVGVPQDAAAALASFIMTDIFGRFPNFKISFVHGGGSFGAVLDRMNHVWHEFPELQKLVKIPPRDYIKKFHFDTVTFSADYLAFLVKVFGADVLMAGTDGPTLIGQRGLERFIGEACEGDPVASEKILWRNAARFFELDDVVAANAAAAAA
jgi:aminocarboxymuconate-semialdehyde decarboxylase